jgi:hypothetical protein
MLITREKEREKRDSKTHVFPAESCFTALTVNVSDRMKTC